MGVKEERHEAEESSWGGVMGLPGFHIREVFLGWGGGVEGVSKAHEPRVWH